MRRLALAFYLGCLLASSGCAASGAHLTAASATSDTAAARLERARATIEGELRGQARARYARCPAGPERAACLDQADVDATKVMAPKVDLYNETVQTQNRAAAAIDAADACRRARESCATARTAEADAALALLAVQLGQLEAATSAQGAAR